MNRILIVEDNLALAQLWREHLELSGYGVEDAKTFDAAVAVLEGGHIDLVVLDLFLARAGPNAPPRGGLSVLGWISTQDPPFRRPKTILVTGADPSSVGGHDPMAAGLRLGADGGLRKPFAPIELVAMIKDLEG